MKYGLYVLFLIFIITPIDKKPAGTVNAKQETETIAPFKTLVEFAGKHSIALTGIHLAPEFSKPHNGDSATLLLTLFEGDETQQWLSIIVQDSLTKEEKKLKSLPDDVIYTSTGRTLKFRNTRCALNIFFIGPFTLNGSETENHLSNQLTTPYRTLVSKEQLNLGLDKYAQTAIELTRRSIAANAKGDDLFYIGAPSPLSKDQLKKGQKYLNLIHPTENEERIRFSVTLALDAFLSAALKINDFSNLLDKVLNRPSVWSVVSNFGVHRGLFYNPADVKPVDIKDIGINLGAYEQPIKLDLNDKPALNASIIMTEARPPLQICAGIIKILAEHPFNHDNKMVIQLIAARAAKVKEP